MSAQPTPKGAWGITFLLFLFMLVNFADKIVVGLAAVPIMTELKLQPEEFGLDRKSTRLNSSHSDSSRMPSSA